MKGVFNVGEGLYVKKAVEDVRELWAKSPNGYQSVSVCCTDMLIRLWQMIRNYCPEMNRLREHYL